MNKLANKLIDGDKRALAKAITLVESSRSDHQNQAREIIDQVLSQTGNSIRIGISGVPGVGKSTFIEALGSCILKSGKKLAVLAVDPSSPVSGGSILGDKTRMEKLSQEENAFIRPSPTSGALGGVAHKTREALLLCEAAGHDVVLVETVGVGQSEYEVASMVDLFIVLMLPGAGDELQGIKKGIIELADLLVVNKADGDNKTLAKHAQSEYSNALHLTGKLETDVLTCSSTEGVGIQEIWDKATSKVESLKKQGSFLQKRKEQNLKWFDQILHEQIWDKIEQNQKTRDLWSSLKTEVSHEKTSAYQAADKIINTLFS